MEQRVRVRFAPSPTGFLHIGGLRTALYNQLMAERHGGDFILRIEDTDQTRLVPGAVESLCRSLQSVGVIPNEGVWLDKKGQPIERGELGPYTQSQRKFKHVEYATELVKMDKAYYCFCSTERLAELRRTQELTKQPTRYDGACRAIPHPEAAKRIEAGESYVIRLKLPQRGAITLFDEIHDAVTFDWEFLDDSVIVKSDGFPTYHLAATCDDHDMQITHVIRGEEWISSAPKHLFIYDAFGWEPPTFAHLPLLLNPDKSKLSKRQGDVAVEDYLKQGYLPDALVNFVALLGWNPTGDREIYSRGELAAAFDLKKINKAGAVFNLEKCKWMNAQYLRAMPEDEYLALTHPFIAEKSQDAQFVDRCLLLVRDRVIFPQEVAACTEDFFKTCFDFRAVHLTWKTQTQGEAAERLHAIADMLRALDEADVTKNVAPMELETRIKHLIAEKKWGNGDTLWPLRVALSGAEKSPTPFELLWAYGKERSLKRIEDAVKFLA